MRLLFLVLIIVFGFFGDRNGLAAVSPARACVQGQCYVLELASTPRQREQGLMSRESLASGHGMLFVFDQPGAYAFWMKNMLFPIDILWIGSDRRVRCFESNVPPCVKEPCAVYRPEREAIYVLEIPAGEVRRLAIHSGALVEFY